MSDRDGGLQGDSGAKLKIYPEQICPPELKI